MKQHWDIFCKIVDNFGDIGICWRLARQLHDEYQLNIRLFIDDLLAAKKIVPDLNVQLSQQKIAGIKVLSWDAKTDFATAADVVIEAFACALPADYLSAMARKKTESAQQTTWVNLEYLSAEPWVADFHAKPSPQANGLVRHFYFPGFTEATGGLIRESDLSYQPPSAWVNFSENRLKISLFCYPHAPIESLLAAMAATNQPIDCYVPASSILAKIAVFLGLSMLEAGRKYTYKNLCVHVLPFLSQVDYDQLLSTCDINFVRGEDSWIRAIWAGKPFIWQPYYQDENTHIQKLNAFLSLFYEGFSAQQSVLRLHEAWVADKFSTETWQSYLENLPAIARDTGQQTARLKKQADLAAKLVIFCNKS